MLHCSTISLYAGRYRCQAEFQLLTGRPAAFARYPHSAANRLSGTPE
jgi:hypothetical protein